MEINPQRILYVRLQISVLCNRHSRDMWFFSPHNEKLLITLGERAFFLLLVMVSNAECEFYAELRPNVSVVRTSNKRECTVAVAISLSR